MWFFEYAVWVQNDMKPLNITLIEYILKYEKVNEVINALDKAIFRSGGGEKSLELIKKTKKELLENEEVSSLYRGYKVGLWDLKTKE